jgi:hypothetical protein
MRMLFPSDAEQYTASARCEKPEVLGRVWCILQKGSLAADDRPTTAWRSSRATEGLDDVELVPLWVGHHDVVKLSVELLLGEHAAARSDEPLDRVSDPSLTEIPWLVASAGDLDVDVQPVLCDTIRDGSAQSKVRVHGVATDED